MLKTPATTIRDTTERPETIECGSNFLSGVVPELMEKGISFMLNSNLNWKIPDGYNDVKVSDKVVGFIMSLFRNEY